MHPSSTAIFSDTWILSIRYFPWKIGLEVTTVPKYSSQIPPMTASKCHKISKSHTSWSIFLGSVFEAWLTLKAVELHTHFTTIHYGLASLILDTMELLDPNNAFFVSAEKPIRSVSDNMCYSISFFNTANRSLAFSFETEIRFKIRVRTFF